jgi:hypothetical protein
MRLISREILKKPRRIWGLFALAATFSSIALLIDGFLQHHLPEPVRIVSATIGTATLLAAIACLLAYMAYDRLNS